MHRVLRLPRKCARSPAATKRAPASPRQSKCCACHAKVAREMHRECCACHANAARSPPATKRAPGKSQTVKVLRLPRRSTARCTECCACHANAQMQSKSLHKSAAGAQRRPSARQVPRQSKCCACHAKVAQMHKVLRLPRKCSARCTKCPCHAIDRSTQRRTRTNTSQTVKVLRPATQK